MFRKSPTHPSTSRTYHRFVSAETLLLQRMTWSLSKAPFKAIYMLRTKLTNCFFFFGVKASFHKVGSFMIFKRFYWTVRLDTSFFLNFLQKNHFFHLCMFKHLQKTFATALISDPEFSLSCLRISTKWPEFITNTFFFLHKALFVRFVEVCNFNRVPLSYYFYL